MTAPQPPYGQPPQGYQMPPPPRKRHTVRNVLLGAATRGPRPLAKRLARRSLTRTIMRSLFR